MLKRLLIFSVCFTFGSFILATSIFRIAEVKYVLGRDLSDSDETSLHNPTKINYELTTAGPILPDNALYPLKAFRDKVWLALTFDPIKKAEVCLMFADKRLASAKILFEKGKNEDGMSILTKGEKYLELAKVEERIAHQKGIDTTEFLQKYSLATLKHREVLDQMALTIPENMKPMIVNIENYPKNLYLESKNNLLDEGAPVAQNPFK